MILLIDNYDSFVFNLARYFERLGQETHVVRNDVVDAHAIEQMQPDAIVLSPGPCTPIEAGCSLDVVRQLHSQIPMLGVCLGHQAIGMAFGGRVIRANEPVHGRVSTVHHTAQNVFVGLPNPLTACRYHSLVVEPETLPASLERTAWCADGTLMGLAHREYPVFGVQFHPESILTDDGYPLLANFLREARVPSSDVLPGILSERVEPPQEDAELLARIITF